MPLVFVTSKATQQGQMYNDQTGILYTFPKKMYRNLVKTGERFVYYRSGEYPNQTKVNKGRKPEYFGFGLVGYVIEDENNDKNLVCQIIGYNSFSIAVPFKDENDQYLEDVTSKPYFRNGVRQISDLVFKRILDKAAALAGNSKIQELSVDQYLTKAEDYFNPQSIEDARKQIEVSIIHRQGQAKFRKQLLKAFKGRCVVTGCNAEPALEAAHIIPYCGIQTNHISNGLLLRADIHTLFDLHLLSINPSTMTILVASSLLNTSYGKLAGRSLHISENNSSILNRAALEQHYKLFLLKDSGACHF